MLSPVSRWVLLARNVVPATVLLILVSCGKSALEGRSDAIVFAWMQCHDCMHDQRNRVIALGDTAVPRLRQILIEGPPRSHDSAYVASFQRLALSAPTLTPAVIERQRQLFAAVYRRRALLALAGIGSSAARGALCLARATPIPAVPPVRLAIDSGLAQIGASCP